MFSAMILAAQNKLRRTRRRLIVATVLVACLLVATEVAWLAQPRPAEPGSQLTTPTPRTFQDAGRVLHQDPAVTFTVDQAEALSRQNYAGMTPKPAYAVKKTVVQYRSYQEDGTPIAVYARVYQPVGRPGAPLFGFAPGTVGMGDQCAPSLEEPAKANWANYESHLVTYAGQGYATVITDYEGLRDPDRIHHYMVGALEGRAVLDSLRALINLDHGTSQLDLNHVFVGGYSQGGHAAFWADQIAASYAPELKLKGVVGFGPVMDVRQTLTDVTHAANINWFGPYLLASYADYYHDTYDLANILQPHYAANLQSDVLSHCIDTNLAYWGHTPSLVYTSDFLANMTNNWTDPRYQQLKVRLDTNIVGNAKTATAKLIQVGLHDNVVLPSQQGQAMTRLCPNSKGPVALRKWPAATHYTTMQQSLADTLAWMNELVQDKSVASTCGS